MGATGTPAEVAGGEGNVRAMVSGNALIVPFSFTMSASYATGGDTVTLPSVPGRELVEFWLTKDYDGTRTYHWDGSLTTPKVFALDAFATEETATTDLSGETLRAVGIFA